MKLFLKKKVGIKPWNIKHIDLNLKYILVSHDMMTDI